MVNKCKQCNAVVNPKWQKCLVCGASLLANTFQGDVIDPDQIASMPIEDFAKQNLAVKVHSAVLGQQIYFVSNTDIMNELKDEGLAIYLPHELGYLIKLQATEEEIKKIHTIKEVFHDGPTIICTEHVDAVNNTARVQ